jgi:hypothetical protein
MFMESIVLRYSTTQGTADSRIRTDDPLITSEELYQLSYVGKTAFRLYTVFANNSPLDTDFLQISCSIERVDLRFPD